MDILIVEAGRTRFGVAPGQVLAILRTPVPEADEQGGLWLLAPERVPYCSLAGLVGEQSVPVERALLAAGPRGRLAYGTTAVLNVRPLDPGAIRPLPAFLRGDLAKRGLLGVALLPEGEILLADLSILHPACHDYP